MSIYKLTLIDTFIKESNPTCTDLSPTPLILSNANKLLPLCLDDQVSMGIWVGIEIDVGVICACMPSMPMLFRPLWKRVKESTRVAGDTANYSGKSSHYGNISGGSGSNKKQRLSPWSSKVPTASVSEGGAPTDIRMVTAIHQTSNAFPWDTETAGSFAESTTELHSPRNGIVKTQAWSGSSKDVVGSIV